MSAILDRYGFDAFGIDFDVEDNGKLIQAIKSEYEDQEKGAMIFNGILAELYQKGEAIMDGKTTGYRMFSQPHDARKENLTKKVFEFLKDKGWGASLRLENGELRLG